MTESEKPQTLVITRSPSRFFPDDIKAGWRITCQNGDPYDIFWASVRPERYAAFLADVRAKHGEVTVLDLRDRPEDVRDSKYVKRMIAAGLTP